MRSEDFSKFDMAPADTRMDLVFKERLRALATARLFPENGCIPFKHYDGGDADDAVFRIEPSNITNACSDFDFQGIDAAGHYDCMDYYQMPNHILDFDSIVQIFYTLEDDDSVLKELTIENVTEKLVWDENESGADLVLDFLKAYKYAKEGKVDTALSFDVYGNFCRDMAENVYLIDDTLGAEFIAMCAEMCICPFVRSTEDYTVRCAFFYSREVFLYEKYKDRLPLNIRQTADGYIRLFKNPFDESEADGDTYYSFDVNGYTVVVYSVGQRSDRISGLESRYFNCLYEAAVKWLDDNLPVIRERFYPEYEACSSVEDTASVCA